MDLTITKANKKLARHTSLTRRHIRQHLRQMAVEVGQNHLVLDLGCGLDAPYKDLFQYEKYIGIDLFEPANIKGDITHLPICSDLADLVIFTEVLEHLPEPALALMEINRVLRYQRYLVLTVPLVWGEHDYVDYHRWTQAGLLDILNKAGFEVVSFRRRGGIFSLTGSLISQIPQQVFGTFAEQRNWLVRSIYLFCILLLLPLPWIGHIFDPLDKNRKFVHGFDLLCKKHKP